MDQGVSEIVESYLNQYGWSFRSVDARRWLTGWQGMERYFPLQIVACDSWITFCIKPLIDWHEKWENSRELAHFLLELNDQCPMIKLHLDEAGDICLGLSVFAAHLDYENFYNAVGLLGYYADYLFTEILNRILYLENQNHIATVYLT